MNNNQAGLKSPAHTSLIMKKIILSLISIMFTGAMLSQTKIANNHFLFSPDIAILKIDTTSIERKDDTLFLKVIQYPRQDSISIRKLLQKYGEKVTEIVKLESLLDCDCKGNKLKLVNYDYKIKTGEDYKVYLLSNHSRSWSNSVPIREQRQTYRWYWETVTPNSAEAQLVDMLCSKYIYQTNGQELELNIEDIPLSVIKYPDMVLSGIKSYNINDKCNKPYKDFKAFAKDTTAFLRYNFVDRADCYRYKTVDYVLKDLKMKPQSYKLLYPRKDRSIDEYEGICIYLDNNTPKYREQNPQARIQYVNIYWPKFIDDKDAIELIRKPDGHKWDTQHYDFFKNMIVGEVAYYR